MKGLITTIAFAVLIPFACMAGYAQEAAASHEDVQPVISNLTISPDTVTDLRLKPLYAATIRMPEPVSSVVVGAPTFFQAEHNEHEPELVIVKPITTQAAASNLLIATKSGQVVSLRLISDGAVSSNTKPVDFVLTYKQRKGFLIGPSDETSPANSASAKQTLRLTNPLTGSRLLSRAQPGLPAAVIYQRASVPSPKMAPTRLSPFRS